MGDHGGSLEAIVDLLRGNASFASMGETHLAAIAGGGPVERALAGQELFRQGDTGDFAYLVLSGVVAVEVETDAGRVTVARIGRGQLVGEIAAFASTPRTATVSATEDATLLRIEQHTIRSLLHSNPDTAMSIIAELGQRLQSLNGTIAVLTQAAQALARDEFEPGMLQALHDRASRFNVFAGVFEGMARELSSKRAMALEMRTAAEIQRSFLPRDPDLGPQAGRIDIAATMIPAREIGGDFYDYFRIGERHVGFAVGDVSGKGIPAALFMTVSRTMLKAIAREGGNAGEILTRMNALMVEDNREHMFLTLAFATLDVETGDLDCAAGGHEEVYLLTPLGVRKLSPTGPALGLLPDVVFRSEQHRLVAGDAVVFATDGVTEAFDAEGGMFGHGGMEAVLAAYRQAPAAALTLAVEGAVGTFAGGGAAGDDLTCLALRYLG